MSTAITPTAYTIPYGRIVSELTDDGILFSCFKQDNKTPKQAKAKKYHCVWDTGCSGVAISNRIAAELGLKPIDITKVATAGGIIDSNVYILSLWLPNRIHLPQVRVTECRLSAGLDCLIGMDVIKHGDFCVSNFNGKTTMSFRVPSVEATDYYAMSKPKTTASKIA